MGATTPDNIGAPPDNLDIPLEGVPNDTVSMMGGLGLPEIGLSFPEYKEMLKAASDWLQQNGKNMASLETLIVLATGITAQFLVTKSSKAAKEENYEEHAKKFFIARSLFTGLALRNCLTNFNVGYMQTLNTWIGSLKGYLQYHKRDNQFCQTAGSILEKIWSWKTALGINCAFLGGTLASNPEPHQIALSVGLGITTTSNSVVMNEANQIQKRIANISGLGLIVYGSTVSNFTSDIDAVALFWTISSIYALGVEIKDTVEYCEDYLKKLRGKIYYIVTGKKEEPIHDEAIRRV